MTMMILLMLAAFLAYMVAAHIKSNWKSASLFIIATFTWIAALTWFAPMAVAQDVPPADPGISLPAGTGDFVTGLLVTFSQKAPWLLTVVAVIGALRLIIKPVIAALHYFAEQTATPKDDELIAKIENSKILKTVFFVLDWFGSVKVRK